MLVKVRVADTAALEALLLRIRRVPGVDLTITSVRPPLPFRTRDDARR